MSYTQRFTEVFDPLLTEFADSRGPIALNSAYADMETYHRAVLILNVGEMGRDSTFDCSLWEAQDNIGTGAALIAGKSITQLSSAVPDGDDLLAIELRTEEMTPGYKFVQVRITILGGAVEFCYTLFGSTPRYAYVPTTAWAETVN